jgi:predicted ATPase
VGREREVREVSELLGGHGPRLLTLTGIGGVGKTRLALEAARASLDGGRPSPTGPPSCPLAPLGDPALVLPAVARSLGLREAEGRGAAEALRAYLGERRTLLVLDNFEHLLGAAAGVAALIEACPGLRVLATSRAPLRVRGEQEYPVRPLALAPLDEQPSEEEVLRTPSGRLFAERARAASPAFSLTPENAPAVAAICWRLAGIAPGAGVAAAKVRFLEPAVLLDRLDQALTTAWARDLPERQRTMRAALDWSHELLSEPERTLFRRLSVFVGGFTLEAAEAVGTGEGPEEMPDLLDPLGALVEQSLVAARPPEDGREARYGMLEPVRQYAREKLEESLGGRAGRRAPRRVLRGARRAGAHGAARAGPGGLARRTRARARQRRRGDGLAARAGQARGGGRRRLGHPRVLVQARVRGRGGTLDGADARRGRRAP